MHRTWMLAVSMCAYAAVASAQAPAGPPKPRPEHKKLEVFVGNWKYEGENKASPFGPAGKVSGSDRIEMLGGFFLTRHFEEKTPGGDMKGIEIIGYDPVRKTYTDRLVDSSGVAATGTVTLTGSTWRINMSGSADGAPFKQRCNVSTPASNSFTVKCDASADGKTWAPVFEGKWTKS